VRRPGIPQDRRNAAHGDVGGLALRPFVERRLQLVAIGAAVPEKIDDLDALPGLDRLRGDEAVLQVLARTHFLCLRRAGKKRSCQQRQDAAGEERGQLRHGGDYLPAARSLRAKAITWSTTWKKRS
jgi:hypothetical protein